MMSDLAVPKTDLAALATMESASRVPWRANLSAGVIAFDDADQNVMAR
jgi:hypothetical protein